MAGSPHNHEESIMAAHTPDPRTLRASPPNRRPSRRASSLHLLLCIPLLTLPAVSASAQAAADTVGRDSAPATAPAPGRDLLMAGFLGAGTGEFVAAGVSIGLLDETGGWTLRGAFAEEFTIFGPSPNLNVWDVSLLWTRAARAGVIGGGVALGPALTGGMNRGRRLGSGGGWFDGGDYEEAPFATLGLVGTLDVTAALLPELGVGVSMSGNLNAELPYAAAFVRVVVGRLR